MKLSIIIVNWNIREDVVNCLRSIEENQPRCEYEVIVVDNASTDGSAEAVRQKFPWVRLIVNEQNLGFAAGNNVGLKKASGEYVLFLNSDTIVHRGSFDGLVSFMDGNPEVGGCGPKLLNQDGTVQPSARRFPTLRGILHYYTILRVVPIFRSEYRKWHMRDFKHDRRMDVDQVKGAALMARRSIVEELGRMDEAFFMYYEEVDLCYGIKQAGWRVAFVPDVAITHLGGRSMNRMPVDRRVMTLRSMLTFLRKRHGRAKIAMFNLIFKPGVILLNLCDLGAGAVTYVLAALASDRKRRENGAAKASKAAQLLAGHSWQILFKI